MRTARRGPETWKGASGRWLVTEKSCYHVKIGKTGYWVIIGSNCLRRFSGTTNPLLTCLIAPAESSRKVVGSVLTPNSFATSGASSILYAVSATRSLPYSVRIRSRIGLCAVLHTEHPSDQKYTTVGLFDAEYSPIVSEVRAAQHDQRLSRRVIHISKDGRHAEITEFAVSCPSVNLTVPSSSCAWSIRQLSLKWRQFFETEKNRKSHQKEERSE